MGIIAETARTLNSQKTKRDRENELLFRGLAIKDAIESYYNAKKDNKHYPLNLKELVSDSRFSHKRHLRKLYQDPINRSSWQLITTIDGGISGVVSSKQ